MKGTILNIDAPYLQTGIIVGEDGQRYKFTMQDWKGNFPPAQGMNVDFMPNGEFATEIFSISSSANTQNQNRFNQNQTPQFSVSGEAKQRLIFILLGVFLGVFGIHNFYIGNTGRGIAQLLITILSLSFLSPIVWIWAIIEIVTVTNDSKGIRME